MKLFRKILHWLRTPGHVLKPTWSDTDHAFLEHLRSMPKFCPEDPSPPDMVDRLCNTLHKYQYEKDIRMDAMKLPQFQGISDRMRERMENDMIWYSRQSANIHETLAAECES